MIAQEEKKKSTLRRITDEITKLRKLRDGAAAMARKVVERHNGDVEAVKSDPDYLKSQSAFKDFSSSLSEKESRITDLESDVGEITESITGHKTQLESLLREIETVKQEKHQTVAEIITAKEEREIADMITGISNDRTSEELQELRDIRGKAKAGARISREMAGTDVARSEAEFLEYADKSVASDEFDATHWLDETRKRVGRINIGRTDSNPRVLRYSVRKREEPRNRRKSKQETGRTFEDFDRQPARPFVCFVVVSLTVSTLNESTEPRRGNVLCRPIASHFSKNWPQFSIRSNRAAPSSVATFTICSTMANNTCLWCNFCVTSRKPTA